MAAPIGGDDWRRGLDLGPDDSVMTVRCDAHPVPGDPDCQVRVVIALHRRHGDFTHVYRILTSPRLGRGTVHLRRVFAGDRIADAKAWVLEAGPERHLRP